MRNLGIALVLCVLTGCASVDELRKKEPAAHLVSSRTSAGKVASCIATAWNDQRIGIESNGASLRRDGDDYVVVSPASGTPAEVAVVSQAGGTSTVSIFAQAALDVGGRTRKRTDAARSCM